MKKTQLLPILILSGAIAFGAQETALKAQVYFQKSLNKVESITKVKKMLENKNIKSRGASVINISSIMGKVSPPIETPRPQSIYTITKHAVEGLTKSLSVELAPHNIRVNSVCPTYVNTSLVKKTMENPKSKKYFLDRIPLGRMAEVRDVENAVIYLCSDMSSMVTGTSLMVDGGWVAQ